MHRHAKLLIFILLLSDVSLYAGAQATATAISSIADRSIENVPLVPGLSTLLDGFNAGINFSAVHNSLAGWYEMATPAISYTFTSHYSVDASTRFYLQRFVQSPGLIQSSVPSVVSKTVNPGDTLISFHAGFHPGSLREVSTFSMSLPTGSRSKGFGTGHVTVDFNHHLEHYRNKVGVLLDLGFGDSTSTANNLLTLNYDSLGALAHFQTGAAVWLFRRNYIQAVAYEQLPIGKQTLYPILIPPVPLPVGIPTPPVPPLPGLSISGGASEDNGFTTFIGIPLASAFTSLSGYYNRSLRQHQDTVSFGITYVLHGQPWSKKASLIDRALREATRTSTNEY